MTNKTLDSKGRTALKCSAVLVALCAALMPEVIMAVGHWVPVATGAPNGNEIGTMLLLSDGTVMAQRLSNTYGDWYRLTPDNRGGYTNGTWTTLRSMNWPRLYYSSVVLRDGRVFVAGAEESLPGGGDTAEVYDPANDAAGWTELSIPSTLLDTTAGQTFDDSPAEILPDGRVLIAPVVYGTHNTLIYDAVMNTWTAGANFHYSGQDEASWIKLADDSILTADPDNVHSERYIPLLNQWIGDSNPSVNIYGNGEMGPALLLPDGRAFFLGGAGRTALYTPTGTTNEGTWAVGPDIPSGVGIADSPAAMMVNGKVLCMVGSSEGNGGNHGAYHFYEYDEYDYTTGPNGTFVKTSSPGNASVGSAMDTIECSCFFRFLDLPDGTVLASFGSYLPGQLYVYVPDSSPLAQGKPAITSLVPNLDGSYHLTGMGLNGVSEGAAFGDDAQMNSNYPLVRLTDGNGNVYYARTYNWSSTGVMTGNKPVTTEFTLPNVAYQGGGAAYSLVVVANGIASDPVTFYAPVWVQYGLSDPGNGTYSRPYNTLARGTNAVLSGGTILFKYPGSTPEKPRLAKPKTIGAVGGPATIGR